MTVAEVVKQKTEALAPQHQQEVLHFVESLGERERASQPHDKPTLESVRKALAAAAGMWQDRTDLPEDSAEAAQTLRDCAMQRGAQ